MAQPLFNEHPLQDYLRRSFALAFSSHLLTFHLFTESGDIFEPMPGAMSDLPDPFSEECADTDSDADLKLWSWLPTPTLRLVQVSRFCFNPPPSSVFRWQIGLP
jgi:hypothetical protein